MIELCNNRFVQMSSAEDTNATNKKKTSRRNPWGNCSYADLITQAIESSPEKKLTLSQIYDWMIRNIPHFSNQGSSNSSAGWKNSIRHNLSLHKKFLRIRNEGTTGRSSWWTVNKLAGAGRTTRRKNIYKRKKNKSTFKQKTEIFRKVKITGKKLLDCFLSVPNNEDRTRNLQRNISKLMINSPRKRFKSYSSNSSEDNIPIHCNATYDTDTFISYPNSNACQISHSFLSDQSSDSNGIATNYSMNEGSQNKVEIFSAGGNNFYTNCNNEESAVFFKEDYIPKNPSPISIQKNFSVNVSREYFKSPHHLSGSYITSEIGKMPSEICLQNSIYDSKKADLNTYNLPQLSENGIHYLLAESNAFSFNQRTAFDSTRDLLNLTLCNPHDTEIVDQSHKSISTSFPFLNHEDQTGENNFHLDNFCKLDVELISKTKLLLERSDNSDYTEDSVDEEDNLTSDENSTNVSKKQRSGKSIQRLKDFLNEEQKTMPTHMDSNIDSDKYSDHALSPSDSINSCSQAMDSDSFDIPKSFTFTDGFHLEYLLCLEKCSYFSLGFLPDMILNSCETFYPVEVSVSYENENENNMATEELAPQKITFSRFAPVLNKNTNPLFLKPTDAVSKTIKAFINNDIETKNFRQKFPDTVDKLPVLIQLLILNAVNMALLRIQIMSGSQSLTDDVVHTFNELSKTFTLKQMLCFAMEFLILVTNLYYLFVHKVISSQLNLYDTSDLRLPKNTCITNAGECIATYLNMLYVIIDVQFSEKMLNDSKLRHFTSPPKFTSFVSVYLNDPDRTNVGITKEELANTLKLLNQDFDLAFKWNSYSQPNSPYNRIIYAGYFNFPRDADNSKNNSESSYEYPVTCFEANLPSFSKHHTISPNFKIQLKSKCNPVPTNSMENIQIESSNEANAMNLYKPTSTNAVDNNIQINSSHATSEVNEVKRDALSFYEISSPINLGSTLMNFRDDIQLQHTYNPASTNIVEKSVQYESSYDTNAANTNNLISANTVCQRIPLDINYEASETNLEKGDEFQPYQYSSYLNLAPSSFLNAIQLQYADKSIYNVQFDTSHKVNVENNAFYTNILSQPPQIVTTYNDSVTDTSKEDIFQSPGISLSENLTPAADNTFNSIQLDYTGNPTSTNTVDNINMYSSQDATAVNTNNLTSTSLVDHLTQINGNHNTSDKNLGKDSLCQFQEFNNFTHSVSTSNFLKTPQLQCTDHHRSFENNIQVQSNSVISEANKRQGVKHYSKLRNLLMKRSKIFDILPTDLKDIPLYAIPPITEMIYKYIDFYFGTYDKEFDNYLKQLQNCKSIM